MPETRPRKAQPKRTRCTWAGCKRLAPKGRRRCEDHKPGARPRDGRPANRAPLIGCTEARIYTRPLRPLTRETSRGWEVIEFARLIGKPLLPWQEWAAIHALELNPDGTYRFRTILIIVSRQNGKSALAQVITLWRMYMDGARRIIGLAQDVALARDQWNICQETIHACPDLEQEWGRVRNVNGDEWFEASGCRYGIKAANRRAGRGGSNDQVNIDELREQLDWKAWAAAAKTTMARPNGLVVAMSNAGDDTSVVLNQLQDIGEAGTDPALCILEWSAPKGCELDDERAWCQANPGLGYIISEQAIRSSMLTDPPGVFRTEVMCQRVDALNSAIDTVGWQACKDSAGSMAGLRDRVACVFEVSENGEHATLVAAAKTADGRPRLEVVAAWDSAAAARAGIAAELAKVRPAAFGWFPGGPAAEMATVLRPLALACNRRAGKRQPGDPPENGEISGARVTEVCQELGGLVRGRSVIHPGDPLLDSHIRGAVKLMSGDGWRFTRHNGDVDAAYAAAGAVSMALAMPEPRRARVRVLAG
jgi:hypothetical protein